MNAGVSLFTVLYDQSQSATSPVRLGTVSRYAQPSSYYLSTHNVGVKRCVNDWIPKYQSCGSIQPSSTNTNTVELPLYAIIAGCVGVFLILVLGLLVMRKYARSEPTIPQRDSTFFVPVPGEMPQVRAARFR